MRQFSILNMNLCASVRSKVRGSAAFRLAPDDKFLQRRQPFGLDRRRLEAGEAGLIEPCGGVVGGGRAGFAPALVIAPVGNHRREESVAVAGLRMRGAKNGQWWEDFVHRSLANNSVAYTEKPEIGIFMKEWISLYESKSGERGIFNRRSAIKQAKLTGRRETDGIDFGTNPCGEILLRPNQFCNLSEVVIREGDTLDRLKEKVK